MRGVVLDVDGTVLRGSRLVDGARAGLDALARAGVRRLFVSNNPTKTPDAYAARLRAAGVEADADAVVTSGTTTVRYLHEHHPDDRLLVVGEDGLREQLRAAGLTLVDGYTGEGPPVDAVVASIDRDLTYDDLTAALWAIQDGATLVGTDPDRTIPTADRDLPGSGAVVGAVTSVADRDPDVVLGKPSPTARQVVRERLGLPAADCLVVGDRLDTDVALGAAAGMETALVLTGVASRADARAADAAPDHVLDSLADVEALI
ncbi:MAG: putative sugar phosphatases of the HAD superfamily [uncultured archaeon A07HB70]|nr:MAG: putative sugar phosphatases of the HAD superfamily [uncultured archaeon A07HB70]